jgi:hypothetical protein
MVDDAGIVRAMYEAFGPDESATALNAQAEWSDTEHFTFWTGGACGSPPKRPVSRRSNAPRRDSQ